jgi:hypothetical protein
MRLPFKVVADLELAGVGVRVLYGVGSKNSLEVGDFCETELGDKVIRITVEEIGMRKMEFIEAGIDSIVVDVQPRDTPKLYDHVLQFLEATDPPAKGSGEG